tara:strand:- start:189886 stop:190158 length:273 start_codon:yes stop_codon:yes gene_type:complete
MQVVHTAGVPPNQGNTHLLMTGCTWNTKNAPNNVVAANQKIDRPLVTGLVDVADRSLDCASFADDMAAGPTNRRVTANKRIKMHADNVKP